MKIPNSPAPCNAQDTLLPAALRYHSSYGWSVIPVTGKKPPCLWMPFQEHPADEKTLRRLFSRKNITGLALVTGKVSGGIAVRDFDLASAYHAWAAANPEDAARSPTSQTARGFHVFGTLAEEAYITYPDGELRGDSLHYTLIPPSVHPNGTIYRWVVPLPSGDLPLLPASLMRAPCTPIPSQTQDNPGQPIACARKPQDAKNGVELAIARTLPTGPGMRNRKLFDLARELKAIIPEAEPDELRGIVYQWYTLALPVITTRHFGESWSDFTIAWQRVQRPVGCSLRAARQAAEREAPAVADRYDGPLRRLVALCWQLSLQWGEQPFPLGCRTAGDEIGVTPIQAWRLLSALQFDKVIKRTWTGTKKDRLASEWVYTAR